MPWRKWVVRGLVFIMAAGLGIAALLYHRWTHPTVIRRRVLSDLTAHFPKATVSLESATLRLLGGIALRELRMGRRDNPKQPDFLHIPSAVLFHDKEQLVEKGVLFIRKAVLYEPEIRVIRDADGKWNLEGLMAPTRPEAPLPTIVIERGKFILEDDFGGNNAPPIVIENVNLTMLNDPPEVVVCRGAGSSRISGKIKIEATWQRQTGVWNIAFRAPAVTLQPALWLQFAAYAPRISQHLHYLAGTADIQGKVQYHAAAEPKWRHNLHCRLLDARFRHPRLPLEFTKVKATLHSLDGMVTLKECTAEAGQSHFELSGWARPRSTPAADGIVSVDPIPDHVDFGGHLRIKDLLLESDLFARLPAEVKKLYTEYAPQGKVDLTVECSRLGSQWKRHCLIHPKDVSASFWRFPYRLHHITGTLDHEVDNVKKIDRFKIDLVGREASQPVYVRGVSDSPPDGKESLNIKIWGKNLPINEKLIRALPAKYRTLAESFQPRGLIDYEALIHWDDDRKDYRNRYVLALHEGSIRFNEFPYPLENVRGVLDIRPDRWEFHDFTAKRNGGKFAGRGHSLGTADQAVIILNGQNVALDDELEKALHDDELREAWAALRPNGRMDFHAHVTCAADKAPTVDVTVVPLGCTIEPTFLPYRLEDVRGRVRYASRWVHAKDLTARHGASALRIDEAKVYIKPHGGLWMNVLYLHGTPLVVDDELVSALPPKLAEICRTIEISGPITLRTLLTLDMKSKNDWPVVFWDGEIKLQKSRLRLGIPVEGVTGRVACRGRHDGRRLEGLVGNVLLEQTRIYRQPVTNIQAQFEIPRQTPDVLIIPGLKANLFGGEVYGPVRIEFGSQTRYEMNLTGSRIKLEEFGRHNLDRDAPLEGLVSARLYLSGRGSDVQNLSGAGTIDVPKGRLYNLPLLLDLLKFLGFRLPDGTAFEEAHAEFKVRGSRLEINKLDLFGHSISLQGHGEMNLDGTDIDLEFYAVWTRFMQLLPPLIKEIPPALSKYLLKIKAQGSIHDVKFTKEPVPGLVEPLKGFLERLPRRRRLFEKKKTTDRPFETVPSR
ncbi:MAG: hypothetical protein KatS3mg105_2453 [Gemmatales bacterium]|nr:MAG: hypothetical protein KatS3mg105_2453 [Gemmatales bacterium]